VRYGLFKIVEEEMYRQYHLGWHVPVVIARFGLIWTDETAQNANGALDRKNKKIIQRMDRNGDPLVRQDSHINDAVQRILLCLEKDDAVGEDFNFMADAPYSSEEMCRLLTQCYNWPVEQIQTDWHSWTISNDKARSMLGYRPQIDILDWIRGKLT
jgi:nucleoside-diphosphate-sugar epimerase